MDDNIQFLTNKLFFTIFNFFECSYLQSAEVFKGKIHIFHIKDCVFEDGKLRQVAPSKGMFDFEKILSKIKAYDKDATLVLEGTTGEDIVPCSKFIREVWDRV